MKPLNFFLCAMLIAIVGNAQPKTTAFPTESVFTTVKRFDNVQKTHTGMIDGEYATGCETSYFLTTYVDSVVKIWFQFSPQMYAAFDPSDLIELRWNITKDGDPTFIAHEGYWNSPTFINRIESDRDFTFVNSAIPISFTPHVAGSYRLVLQWYDALYGGWVDRQVVDFEVIPKITKLWIEADPICVGNGSPSFPDNKYHFKIKTDPAISSVMHSSGLWLPGTSHPTYNPPPLPLTACDEAQRLFIGIATEVTPAGGGTPILDVFSNFRTVNAANLASYHTSDDNSAWGTVWTQYNHSTETDFWVNYTSPSGGNSLSDYITGTLKSVQPEILLNITDGVSLNTTLHAPIIITNPSVVVPPYATHHPAYHSRSYTVPNNIPSTTPTPILSETWTPTSNPAQQMTGGTEPIYKIENTLTIPAGKSLTISNMQIEFGPNGSIEVQTSPGSGLPGGYLELNNSTLTANRDCGMDNNRWKGVSVEGDAMKDQFTYLLPSGQFAKYQGYLRMNTNSVISYAKVGVSCIAQAFLPNRIKTGGVVVAYASRFENNEIAVKIEDYPVRHFSPTSAFTFGNQCQFRNCDFTANIPVTGFVAGKSINGLNILGSRFANNTLAQAPNTIYGVYGTDFGVKVDQILGGSGAGTPPPPLPSTFSNLGCGVCLQTVNGSTSTTVRNSSFNNNTVGVSTNGVTAPNISYNTFTIPSGTPTANALGVVVNTGSGYGVIHNSFSAIPGSVYGTAVNIINTGSDNNVVHSNVYQGLWGGNLSNFLNRNTDPSLPSGLQFLCNTDNNNTHDIAARGHHNFGNSIEGMAPNQGSVASAAGNTFSPGALFNIYNYTSEVQPINYYYNSGPLFFPNTVYGTPRVLTPNPGNCDYPNDNNGGNGGGPYIGNGGPIGPRSHARVVYYLSDSSGMAHTDSLDQALRDWGSPYADLTKADLLIEQGGVNQANTIYNAIVSTHNLAGLEANEFNVWGRRLMDLRVDLLQDSLGTYDLNSAQVQNLEGIADSAALWAKVRARNWLSAFDGRTFVTEMLFPQDSTQQNNQRMIKANAVESYILSPNPVKNVMQLAYNKMANEPESVVITDVSGRTILVTELIGLSGAKDISLVRLETGIYFYKIMFGKEVRQTGKFVKQ